MRIHGVTLIYLAIVALTFKIVSRPYTETVRCRKLILDRDISWGCRWAM